MFIEFEIVRDDGGDRRRACFFRVAAANAGQKLFLFRSRSDEQDAHGRAVCTRRAHFAEVEGGTQLALKHEGFPGSGEAFGLLAAFDAGWDDHLKRMRGLDA